METRVKEESLDEESLIHDEIDELFDHIKNKGLEVKKRFVEKLKEVAFPYDTELNDPPMKRRRGRPKKDSTTRDPSAWEYIDKKFQAGRGRGRSRPPKVPKSSGPENNISNSSPKQGNKTSHSCQGKENESERTQVPSGRAFLYFNQITRFIAPFIIEWNSVKGDENYGYRPIAREIWE
ncbi:hypothetical protein LIER_26132 [Lithospermum erythrorhizon]|uniref:Uncharacterized protein n=1 Tax=Lithospermum erythrorhizon TaxID=34254 RepID=A0AAV3R7B2_LITER